MRRTLIAVLVAFIAIVATIVASLPAVAGTCAENPLDSVAVMSPESWNWDGPSEDDSNCDYGLSIRNKIDPNLLRLAVSSADATLDSASSSLQPATLSGKERVHIQVLAKTEDMESAKALLLSLGGEISGTGTVAFVEGPADSDVGIIQGWSPVRSLEELAASDAVSYVRIPLKALIFQEAANESLAASFDLEAWHNAGFRGGGVKVGVLDAGFAGILEREYQDLPLIETRSFADTEPDDPCGDRSQGTHSLRTIHEIAPEAELYAAIIETLVDAQEAVSWLVNDVGVDIVRIPLVSIPVPDEYLALPDEETENPIFAGNVFWATPEPATWKKHWSGLFQDRGDGFHLFALNRNVEPAELPDDAESISENSPATHVFIGWENPEGAKTDLDLHLLQWDGSGWNPVAESAKVRPGVLSLHNSEYLSTDSNGTERFYGYAVCGNTLAGSLNFEISTSEDNVFTGETSKPTPSMAAGMAALIASARPGLSANEIQSFIAALCQDPNPLPEVLSGYEATIYRTKAGETGCIEFLSTFNFTYCNGDPDFWVDHDEWGWTADRALSAKRLELECKVVNAGTNIRVLVNGSEVTRWYAEVGEVHHVEDIDVEIAQGDTVVFGHGNAPDGCVDVDEDSPVRVVFWDAPIPTTGSLQVTIVTQGAIDAGAKWQVDGGEWQNSGDTVAELAEGNHTVSYSSVAGWNKPDDAIVTITAGETATASGTYTQQTGSLRVTISPQEAIEAGAQWRVNSGTWLNNGATVGDLTVGSHTVEFNTIEGWITPTDRPVTVTNGQTATSTGTYTLEEAYAANLRVLKVNDAVDGTVRLSFFWNWQILVDNVADPAESDAVFSKGEVILTDFMPIDGVRYEGQPVLTNLFGVFGTGSVSCDLTGTDGNVITCLADNGTVIIVPDGGFTVSIKAIPFTTGLKVNPTNGICRVDPYDTVAEIDHSDNDCQDSVIVQEAPYDYYVEPLGVCGSLKPCFDSIQDAINMAYGSPVIHVAEGEYDENVVLNRSAVLNFGHNYSFSFGNPENAIVLTGP